VESTDDATVDRHGCGRRFDERSLPFSDAIRIRVVVSGPGRRGVRRRRCRRLDDLGQRQLTTHERHLDENTLALTTSRPRSQ
jgi:hypothetical protein